MRIVIDMQGAQATNRFRGIGQYSLQFARTLVKLAQDHEVFLALNAAFGDAIEPIRATFDGLMPQERILVWEAPGPLSALDAGNGQRRRAAEAIREAFIARLQPDWVLVTSLFEGFVDDAVTSIGSFQSMPTAVVLYDLIPLIHRSIYLSDPIAEAWYLQKLDHLRRADLLLAISKSSGEDAVVRLAFEPERVVAIGTDCDARFKPHPVTAEQRAYLQSAYGLKRPFVMYTGGIDHRKNIEGLIQAYAALPQALRENHQLAVVCSISDADLERLQRLACAAGLEGDMLVLTGFVPEKDLLLLYNACRLFVFPSLHEGFGLPVLEAMRCGKPVLAANTSSLPEVVGRSDALFDPHDVKAMAALISRALSDEGFRSALEQHALVQSQNFSWHKTAQRALAALKTTRLPQGNTALMRLPARRPKLAYVSPLPPARSGIAEYSAELIPELLRWYEVEVIVAEAEMCDSTVRALCPLRSVAEFCARAADYDRVLYHFGNSAFHVHMFTLLEEIPGVVVLHDFFLSGIQHWREAKGWQPYAFAQALLQSHGYHALRERYSASDVADAIWRYPANLSVLQAALGIIVHSEYSRTLARHWYGNQADAGWAVIPHLRQPAWSIDRADARRALGLAEDTILVCAFGLLGPTKLNHRLLDAWIASSLVNDARAHLVFVGENHDDDYGQSLARRLRDPALGGRVRTTGWAEPETYRRYLAAADIAVQLRTLSRGETSGTVLDCMNHELATIVNAHGSMADMDREAVWMLPDEFDDSELAEALATLARDGARRQALGKHARALIHERHAPRRCAAQYAEAIETIYSRSQAGLPGLLERLRGEPWAEDEALRLVQVLARNFPAAPRQRQLLVDISELVQRDVRTGIQRVVRSVLAEWLHNPPEGYRVVPVYATVDDGYRYARRFTLGFMDCPVDELPDEPIDYAPGDLFLGLDLQPWVVPAQRAFIQAMRHHGVQVKFVVYDLLCVLMPQYFVPGSAETFNQWLETIIESDGAVCISKAVAGELVNWIKENRPAGPRQFKIDWFHLGADLETTNHTRGLPTDASTTLDSLRARHTFLMVGTLEPRKGHAQVLDAFEQLWGAGQDINLVIVGKQGWMVEAFVERLRQHSELDRRLFWLEGISDEYLEKVYAASTCLIAASYGEGFGLPLIEAAQHKLPIIARDIPVFREVAGEHASYFKAASPDELAQSVSSWLVQYRRGEHPKSDDMPWLTWSESAKRLGEIVLGVAPAEGERKWKSR